MLYYSVIRRISQVGRGSLVRRMVCTKFPAVTLARRCRSGISMPAIFEADSSEGEVGGLATNNGRRLFNNVGAEYFDVIPT